MLELADLILRALYEESGGQIQKPLDALSVFRRRFPAIPCRDVASGLTALAAEGLLTVRPATGAALTTDGLRKLGELMAVDSSSLAEKADVVASHLPAHAPSEPPATDDELELDQIMELIGFSDEEDSATPPIGSTPASAEGPRHHENQPGRF